MVSEAPPLRQDRAAGAWLVVRAISEAGDALWTIALAWTAVHVASPARRGWWSPPARCPGR